jgi:hypothetical protein
VWDNEYDELKGKISNDIYRVIPESSIFPELKFHTFVQRLLYNRYTNPIRKIFKIRGFNASGWFIQQVLKLAIAKRVTTYFYLTLDADVICSKEVTYHDLIQNNRGVINTTWKDIHPTWYRNAERILGFPRSGLTHGVTPAVFNKEAVIRLCEFLTGKVNPTFRLM